MRKIVFVALAIILAVVLFAVVSVTMEIVNDGPGKFGTFHEKEASAVIGEVACRSSTQRQVLRNYLPNQARGYCYNMPVSSYRYRIRVRCSNGDTWITVYSAWVRGSKIWTYAICPKTFPYITGTDSSIVVTMAP
jgi:hypothetical protein